MASTRSARNGDVHEQAAGEVKIARRMRGEMLASRA
jgi:hypothetical protein